MTSPRRQRAGLVRPSTQEQDPGDSVGSPVDDVTLVHVNPTMRPEGLDSTARRVLGLCRPGALSAAEVSAHLYLPRPITKGVLRRLEVSGHLVLTAPIPPAEQHSVTVLERVLHGLQRL